MIDFITQEDVWHFLSNGGEVASDMWLPDGTTIFFDDKGELVTSKGAKAKFSFSDPWEWRAV